MALEVSDLRQFHGTEKYYRHGMNRKVLYTDGVQYVAEEGGAYWLIDDIAIAIAFDPTLQAESFQFWTLQKGTKDSAILSATDGNTKTLFAKSITFTDFPLDKIEFYVEEAPEFGDGARVLMLTSER